MGAFLFTITLVPTEVPSRTISALAQQPTALLCLTSNAKSYKLTPWLITQLAHAMLALSSITSKPQTNAKLLAISRPMPAKSDKLAIL